MIHFISACQFFLGVKLFGVCDQVAIVCIGKEAALITAWLKQIVYVNPQPRWHSPQIYAHISSFSVFTVTSMSFVPISRTIL